MKFSLDIGGDEFADCKVTNARKTKWFFGHDVDEHLVFDIEVEHGGRTYEAKLPVALQDGAEWAFTRDEIRAVTETDQRANWDEVLAKFPAYDGPSDLTQEAVEAFVGWLKSGEATVRVLLGGVRQDRNGVDHWSCRIVRSTKAAPVAKSPAAPKKAAKSAPKLPPAPADNGGKVYTAEDSWAAYEGGDRIKSDPQGARYWEEVAKIVGKPAKTYKSFTSEDWMKCVEAFCPMPF